MRDLGVLKERIEYAERHLKSAHTARERESDALLKMWDKIRGRFDAQEQEIGRFREEVSDLTRVNDELSSLVDRLVSIVEGRVGDSANETVPEVARLADGLLQSEPEIVRRSAPPASPITDDVDEDDILDLEGMESDDPLELGTSLAQLLSDDDDDSDDENEGPSFGDILNRAMDSRAAASLDDEDDDDFDHELDIPDRVEADSASEGIRGLIARIEGSVGSDATDRGSDKGGSKDEGDDQLARELQEIESLRDQLNGLHRKVGGND